ncbi:MAG: hypothetical protein M0D55_05825 [Elusimicrobiota bacterium]|nr:MAG: hypothetical protein M0D55_05825 [Elusimicrobiota bacterium]
MKTAVVFLTHYFDAELEARYAKLKAEAPDGSSVFIMAEKGSAIPAALAAETHIFEFARLKKRPAKVIGDRLVPGNVHLAFLDFREAHPDFDHYWFIEYDVVFNGSWRSLFDAVGRDGSDLLAGGVRGRADEPGWFWWPFMDFRGGPAESTWLRGFFPLCRISRPALDAVARRVTDGWTGHHEGLIPTAVREAGLSFSDLGGTGRIRRRTGAGSFIRACLPPRGRCCSGLCAPRRRTSCRSCFATSSTIRSRSARPRTGATC